MDAFKHGWMPLPERGGWMCPDCARRLGYVKPRGQWPTAPVR